MERLKYILIYDRKKDLHPKWRDRNKMACIKMASGMYINLNISDLTVLSFKFISAYPRHMRPISINLEKCLYPYVCY